MIPRLFRFRRFSLRLLTLLLGLLVAALATMFYVVKQTNFNVARERARIDLEHATRTVNSAVAQRLSFLGRSAAVMSGDAAFKQLRDGDGATLASLLQSYSLRTGAPVSAYFDVDGKIIANSQRDLPNENTGPFGYLIRTAVEKDLSENSGFSYLMGGLHALIVVPFYAPYPNIFGWFGLAFPIDREFLAKLRDTTAVELTYISVEDPQKPRLLASTLPASAVPTVLRAAAAANADRMARRERDATEIIELPDDRYVTLFRFQEMLGEDPVVLVLQRPLTPELASAGELENYVIIYSLAILAASALVALAVSRGVSEPVSRLAAHTEKIAAGDYQARLAVDRADELGQLAEAMNQMSIGLDERDRVRDLLDKNVSPEVAAQLLRDGAALGGQEREVTILFSDLRGFTTLSEKLTPPELLVLLNRYFTRMTGPIEQHGGVIDKFIGDSIMALFGAPVAQADSADRAVAAGLAMQAALAELNRELAAEGIAPLGIGIGINTGDVVAGQMGSERRLNYSVIGDGVNVASRLQTLTRTAEYRTNLVVSAATVAALREPAKFQVRALGTVPVKGRAEPVRIFAAD